jgi:hypothetical protein
MNEEEVRRVLNYALWMKQIIFDNPTLHRKRTNEEIIEEVLETANLQSKQTLSINKHPQEHGC